MTWDFLNSIPVCCLSSTKNKKMSTSRYSFRKFSLTKDNISLKRKDVKYTLKCKKNLIHANTSTPKTAKHSKDFPLTDVLNKTPFQRIPKCDEMAFSSERDVNRESPVSISLNSTKKTLRSSLSHNLTPQSDNLNINTENLSKSRSKRLQNLRDEKTLGVSQVIVSKPTDIDDRKNTFYRQTPVSKSRQKSKRLNKNKSELTAEGYTIAPEKKDKKSRGQSSLVKYDVLKKKPMLKTSKQHRMTCSADISILNKSFQTACHESSKRTPRSFLVHNKTPQSESITAAAKNISEPRSKRQQNVVNQKASKVSQIISIESTDKSKRCSFYRQNSAPDNQKAKRLYRTNGVAAEVTAAHRKETERSSNSRKTLHSRHSSNKEFDKERMSVAAEKKLRKSTSQKQQSNECKKFASYKPLSSKTFSPQFQYKTPVVKLDRIPSRFLAKGRYSEIIPIDYLALSSFQARKTKSDGFS